MVVDTPEVGASASLQEGTDIIKASEGGGGVYATSCQSGLMNRPIRGNIANRSSGGDYAGSCWGAASVTWTCRKAGAWRGRWWGYRRLVLRAVVRMNSHQGFRRCEPNCRGRLLLRSHAIPGIDLLQMFHLVYPR